MDLTPDVQPVKSEDGCIVVVMNGEIYNQVELARDYVIGHLLNSRTDTEVFPHLYEEYVDSFPENCVGVCSRALGREAAMFDLSARSLW